MISVNAALTAFLNDIKQNVPGVRTVKSHEGEYDDMLLKEFIPLSPFVLVRYGGLVPVERGADDSAALKRCRYYFTIGSQNLLSESEAAKGCDLILQALRDRYDGKILVTAEGGIALSLQDEAPLVSEKALVVYGAGYSYFDS